MFTQHRPILFVALVLVMAFGCAPSFAWIYDGGVTQNLASVIKGSGTPNCAAQPFKLSADAYATSFGAAVGRAMGTDSMGFNVFLTDTLIDPFHHSIASWTLFPTGTLEYHYAQPAAPILLEADKMYFLMFAPNSANFWGSISFSQTAGYYGVGSSDYGASWYQMSYPFAVRIDGYYVPEADAMAVLALGLFVLAMARLGLLRPLCRCVSRAGADRA